MLHYSGRKIIAFIILFFVPCAIMLSQPKSAERKKLMNKADALYDYGDYLRALQVYDSLLVYEPGNDDLDYKAGVCSYQIHQDREKTLKYFEKLPKNYSNNEVHYYLGVLYHQKGMLEDALTQYESYLNNMNETSEHPKKDILFLIKEIFTAKQLEAAPLTNVRIENMGDKINTRFPEYAPLIPADESFMVFTSRNDQSTGQLKDPYGNYFEDIEITKRTGDTWGTPHSISGNINSTTHDACTGLSADGQKLLIYRTDKAQTGGDIYYSLYDGTDWTSPKILEEAINTKEYLESSACYAPDGETIFFTAVRPEGYGGKDIYRIKKLPNGLWGKPMNLGPTVNTEYDEDAPFVHPKGNILFFCSKGHTNMGGFDIFKSEFNDQGEFTEALNLGYPINTINNDFCFVLNTTGNAGYFASDRPGGYGETDIYKASFYNEYYNLDVVNSYLVDENKNRVKKAEITLINNTTMKVEGTYKPNESTGKFVMVVEPGRQYMLIIKSPDYKIYMEPFTCDGSEEVEFQLKSN